MISIGTVNPLTSIGSEWLRIFSVAVVTLVGHLLLNYSQGKAPFHMMGVLNTLLPVLSTFLAFGSLTRIYGTSIYRYGSCYFSPSFTLFFALPYRIRKSRQQVANLAISEGGALTIGWFIDDTPSKSFPIYTRRNVGEVFPIPFRPNS